MDYNQFMIQGYQLIHNMRDNEIEQPFFFNRDNDEERKIYTPCTIVQDMPSLSPIFTPSKKGRPKGEKNSNKPLKKKKQNEEDIINGIMKCGHWSHDENKRYHWFLQLYSNHFMYKHLRRMDKIFKTMSNFIGSREAEQCRSHHQKMQKKYFTFGQILINLRKLHYGTQDPMFLEQDILANGFTIQNEILSVQILKDNGKQTELFKEQKTQKFQSNSDMIDIPHEQSFDPIRNIFNDDKYQKHFDFFEMF